MPKYLHTSIHLFRTYFQISTQKRTYSLLVRDPCHQTGNTPLSDSLQCYRYDDGRSNNCLLLFSIFFLSLPPYLLPFIHFLLVTHYFLFYSFSILSRAVVHTNIVRNSYFHSSTRLAQVCAVEKWDFMSCMCLSLRSGLRGAGVMAQGPRLLGAPAPINEK